jgi:hypothetical protein
VALGRGSLVNAGTVLGHLRSQPGATSSGLRFAIRPAGDLQAIDAAPIITNWRLLAQAVAAPHTGSGSAGLLGATAGDVFLLSKAELERAVLADPGISIYACGRQDIASGAVDRRVLAVLAFLSRSGLKPTVSALRCGHSQLTTSGAVSEHYYGDAVDISAINGIPILGHQGAGTIADATIRALLTLQGNFIPHQISSLMSYPGATNTLTLPSDYDHIHVGFLPLSFQVPAAPAVAKAGKQAAPVQALDPGSLTAAQWDQLVARIAALPIPSVGTAPSSSAIRDPQAAPGNQGLGTLPPA